MSDSRCRHDAAEDCPDCLRDEIYNYRLALAWIEGQSTDPASRELAKVALGCTETDEKGGQ